MGFEISENNGVFIFEMKKTRFLSKKGKHEEIILGELSATPIGLTDIYYFFDEDVSLFFRGSKDCSLEEIEQNGTSPISSTSINGNNLQKEVINNESYVVWLGLYPEHSYPYYYRFHRSKK